MFRLERRTILNPPTTSPPAGFPREGPNNICTFEENWQRETFRFRCFRYMTAETTVCNGIVPMSQGSSWSPFGHASSLFDEEYVVFSPGQQRSSIIGWWYLLRTKHINIRTDRGDVIIYYEAHLRRWKNRHFGISNCLLIRVLLHTLAMK